jgi:hypothetical protein
MLHAERSWRHEIAHPIGTARGQHRTEVLISDALLTCVWCRSGPAACSDRTSVRRVPVREPSIATASAPAGVTKCKRRPLARRQDAVLVDAREEVDAGPRRSPTRSRDAGKRRRLQKWDRRSAWSGGGVESTGATGLEPATSGVTGRRSNQLSYAPE